MSANGFSGVRQGIPNLCSVPLSALSVEDQELVQNALSWMEFVAEHREKNEGDTCPKDGSRLTWDNYHRTYTCDSCGWSEAPPKQ